MAAGSPGAPARNRGGGSGGRRCQTACDNNKHTAVAPQPPVEMVDQGKSGPGENGGRRSNVAMRQENCRQREMAVAQPQAEPPEDRHEAAGGREGRRPAVAQPRTESPEDQREAAGGRKLLRRAPKNTVCEVVESPVRLREESLEDQREVAGGRNLQGRRT